MPDEGAITAADPAAGSSAQANEGAAGGTSGRQFSQEEVDRMIQQRVGRAEAKFSDYADLQAKAARADELETAQQTETDKLRSKAERETEKRAAAEDKASKAEERANTALKRAAVVAAAAQANAADPGDVFTLLDKSKLTLDDEGNVEGAAEAVSALLKSKPHLLRRVPGGFDGGSQGGSAAQGPGMNGLIRVAAGFGPR